MSTVKFTATKLTQSGKKGILKPDENGYYTMAVGGLNAFNSIGQYYLLEGAKELFQKSSSLMRRVANGCFKGEVGHPKKQPGMSMDEYINRILSIEETNVCCHFKELWLDEAFGKNNPQYKNPNLVAIMAMVKPSGPKGDFLKAAFENPDENVCFSIRSLTKDYFERGQTYRVLQQVVAFDYVTEPGISHANKWSAPSLESIEENSVSSVYLRKIMEDSKSVVAVESRDLIAETLNRLDNPVKIIQPLYSKW